MLDEIKRLADDCPCGQRHLLRTDTVVVGSDASDRLCGYVSERFKAPLIVCDANTEKYVPRLTDALHGAEVIVLSGASHADEKGVEPLSERLKANEYDCLIACGSGSLHDITRYCANERSIPFISYPTAASVDGFVSTVAAMTWKGQKLSSPAAAPIALFADEAVFTDAPERLTASGVGDILGKFTALCDWKLAHILTGETICPEIFGLMERALGELMKLLERRENGEISASDAEYTRLVMESLVLAGLSMQLQGSSRPASGAEHHLSHLWEMHLINSPTSALHGEQIGVASLLLCDFYRRRIDEGFDFTRPIDLGATFDRSYIEPVFGKLTDGILNENLDSGRPESSPLNFRADASAAELASTEAAKLISPDKLLRYLSIAGAPTTLAGLGLPQSDEFIEKSLAYAPYVRRRLTLLKILSAK